MLKVGVLRGGPSDSYDTSLQSGDAILRALRTNPHVEAIDLLLTKDRILHRKGVPISLEKLSREVDLVWNTLHGYYGEDGKIQSLFEKFGIKHTGPEVGPAVGAINKKIAKEYLALHGVKSPLYVVVDTRNIDNLEPEQFVHNELVRINRSIPPPWIAKPLSGGMSQGIVLARSLPELSFAIAKALESEEDLLVEEYIEGRHVSVGVIDNFRNEDLYSLPPAEAKLFGKGKIVDHNMRSVGTCYTVPCNMNERQKRELMDLAKLAHTALGLRHYSESDFVVHPKRGIYYLETDAIPSLSKGSHFDLALQSVGSNMEDFGKHIVHLAINLK